MADVAVAFARILADVAKHVPSQAEVDKVLSQARTQAKISTEKHSVPNNTSGGVTNGQQK